MASCLTWNLLFYNHHRHAVPLIHSLFGFFLLSFRCLQFSIHLREVYTYVFHLSSYFIIESKSRESSAYKMNNSFFPYLNNMRPSFSKWFASCTWLYISYLTVFFFTIFHFLSVSFIFDSPSFWYILFLSSLLVIHFPLCSIISLPFAMHCGRVWAGDSIYFLFGIFFSSFRLKMKCRRLLVHATLMF